MPTASERASRRGKEREPQSGRESESESESSILALQAANPAAQAQRSGHGIEEHTHAQGMVPLCVQAAKWCRFTERGSGKDARIADVLSYDQSNL